MSAMTDRQPPPSATNLVDRICCWLRAKPTAAFSEQLKSFESVWGLQLLW
jgi:hypothetical protein